MVKLRQASESGDTDRQDGQQQASPFQEATTGTAVDGKESGQHGSCRSISSRRWWWVLGVVIATTSCVASIVWVMTKIQPSWAATTWSRFNDLTRTRGNLRPSAPRAGQDLGSTGNEMVGSHDVLADIRAEVDLYERSGVLANGGDKRQGRQQAPATKESILSPEEQECAEMRASLHILPIENRGKAGIADQQRWELLGCDGVLNRVGYPGGGGDVVEQDRSAALAMTAAAPSAEVGTSPTQKHPLSPRVLSDLEMTEATVREENGQQQQQQQPEAQAIAEIKTGGIEDAEKLPALLVIAVVTIRPGRRTAIRNSWLAWADDRLVLRFFTEAPDESLPQGQIEARDLEIESAAYGDLVILDIERGMNFALKLITAMKYVSARYEFDFFLRLDDDYFLCLDHLLDELETTKKVLSAEMMENVMPVGEGQHPLPQLPQPMLYAGFRYCEPGKTRIDEAYMLLSGALVHRVLSIPGLSCGAHAGVTAGSWFTVGNEANKDGDVRWVHDPRLDHIGFLSKQVQNGKVTPSTLASVCEVHMGVHHAYPEAMGKMWDAVKHGATADEKEASGDDTAEFRYVADTCPSTGRGVDAKFLNDDSIQRCDSFHSDSIVHCGAQGCRKLRGQN